jgi:hypothetical protein
VYRSLVPRAGAVWLVLMAVETVHGIARTLLLAPYVGEFHARQVSVLSGSALILLTATLCSRWLGAETRRDRLLVGGGWLVLTVLFELGLGRLVLGYSWQRLLADYDLARGGLMPFGLVVLVLAPVIGPVFRPWLAARLGGFGARHGAARSAGSTATRRLPR